MDEDCRKMQTYMVKPRCVAGTRQCNPEPQGPAYPLLILCLRASHLTSLCLSSRIQETGKVSLHGLVVQTTELTHISA